MPVLSANQVTMWEALRRVGKEAVGPYQALLDPVARRGPAAMTPSPTLAVTSPERRAASPSEPAEPARTVEPEAALASAGAESIEPLEGYDQSYPSAGTDEWGGGSQPPV